MITVTTVVCLALLSKTSNAMDALTLRKSLSEGVFQEWLNSEAFEQDFRDKIARRSLEATRKLPGPAPGGLHPLPDPFPGAAPAPSSGDDQWAGDDYSGGSSDGSASSSSFNKSTNSTTGDYGSSSAGSAYLVGAIVAVGALVLLPLALVCGAPSVFFPDKNGKDASDSNYSSVENIKETVELPVHVEPSPEAQSDAHSSPASKMGSPASKMGSPAPDGLPKSNHSEQEHETFLDPEAGGMTGKWSDDGGPDTSTVPHEMMALDLTRTDSWFTTVAKSCGTMTQGLSLGLSSSRLGSWTGRSGLTSSASVSADSSVIHDEEEDAAPEEESDALTDQRGRLSSFKRQFTSLSQDSAHTDDDSDNDALAQRMGSKDDVASPSSSSLASPPAASSPQKTMDKRSSGVDGSNHSLIEEDSGHATNTGVTFPNTRLNDDSRQWTAKYAI